MTNPFVAVGGDAAGLSAASKLSREDPDREIVVFEKGRWVSYAHCGEPYFVKGEVEKLDDLLSLSPEQAEERGIDLRREQEVVDVDLDAGTVTVDPVDGDRYEQPYGDLLVATGARPVDDLIPGHDLDGAFTIHSLDSAAAIRAAIEPPEDVSVERFGGEPFVDRDLVEKYGAWEPPETVAIVGGGYVGVEMAEAFSAHDLDVHLFQRPEHVISSFGTAVAERVEDELRDRGVTLHLDAEVQTIEGEDRVEAVTDEDHHVPVELALVGIGIRPNVELVAGTDVELGDSGAIATDDYGETSVDGVYAAGDCAEMRHAVTGDPEWVPLGLTANRAGRAIGKTVAGKPEPVGDIAGTAVVKAFDQECGRTGLIDHDRAREEGFDPVTETITTHSRSGYYPGAAETVVSLTADRASGEVLGGAIVGTDRAAIRIDTVAMAVEGDATVAELVRADLAYAPPFSGVWDPVLVAAKVLRGTLEDTTE